MKKALLLFTILCTSLLTFSQTTYVVNTTDDFPDDNLNDVICADKNGNCTFRAALQNANKTSNKDIVNFNISGSAPFTIEITEDILPDILQPILIDGRTQPQYATNHTPVIEISNAFLQYSNGIKLIGNSSGSELYGLCVVNFARMTQYPYSFGYGIISSTANHIIQSNYIGLRADGKTIGGNTGGGLSLGYLGGHLIGGTQPFQGNVISGNPAFGLNISGSSLNSFQSSNNIIQGNLIGTDATGTLNRGNKFNVQIVDSYNNILGGHTPQARNIISGANATDDTTVGTGIAITGTQSYNNAIIGNYIGTDITGTKSIPNVRGGILILFGANTNRIGTDGPGEGNVISGNGQYGIYLQGGVADPVASNLIRGNYIGVDATGNAALPNSIGIMMLTGENNNNSIGGTTANSKNIISGNTNDGITILSGKNNQIIGNYIGTNALGTTAIPNYTGIYLEDSNTIIGGQAVGNRNIISGNTIGIEISESTSSGSSVIGNYIGLNASGIGALPNATGISLKSSSTNSTIGGANPMDKNIISGNTSYGISALGTSHTIQNNFIGLNPEGTAVIKNGIEGMRFSGALTNTKVSENTISGNGTVANQAANVNFIAATDVHFFNNNVGTLPDGNTALVNLGIGIILNGSSNNKIGGSTPNEGNIIGSHNINGLHIIAGSSNNTIDYNKIGVGTDGTTNIGNGSHGIVISGNNTDNKIVNNTIANNKKGVELNPTIGVATKVKISKNSIYNNSVLGIDLIGTTANDVDDLDTGVNNLQNSPEISAINYLGNVSVEVTYNVPSAVTNSAYPLTVEFFGSDNGQGKKYISSDIYTLPGDKTVTLSLPNGFEQNDYNNIVATATDENGNTSEFGTSVNYSLGISPIVSNSLKIFPNPTRDIITIQSNANETLTIDVFDVYGRNVLNKKSANIMNVSSLASGVYLLKIKDENGGVTSAKIIKQ